MQYKLWAQREACPDVLVAQGTVLQFFDGQNASPRTALSILRDKVDRAEEELSWPEGHEAVAELTDAEGAATRWALVSDEWEQVRE